MNPRLPLPYERSLCHRQRSSCDKAECRYLDDQFDKLLDSIPESKQSNTLIVFTADHREIYGEHGLGGHPQQFWEGVIHIPCAISLPSRGSVTFNEQIGLIDLPPTILNAADVERPKEWEGSSRLPGENGEVNERRHVFIDVGVELYRSHAGLQRANGWKLIRHQNEEHLLNLKANPEENPSDNQPNAEPLIFEELQTELDEHLDEMEHRREGSNSGVDDEEMIEDHLQELGYHE